MITLGITVSYCHDEESLWRGKRKGWEDSGGGDREDEKEKSRWRKKRRKKKRKENNMTSYRYQKSELNYSY